MTAARALACALALAACRSDAAAPAAVNEPGDAAPLRATSRPAPRVAPQRRGAPHAGGIDLVALNRDGKAAVTRDHLGGVRVWPALDGSREPLVVPLRGARHLAIEAARDGDEGRVLRIAAVDGASFVRVVDVAAEGSVRERRAPRLSARQVELLPGGDTALVLGADHALALVDADGRERAALEARRFRPRLVLVDASGTRAVAVEGSGGGAVARQVAIDVAERSLRLVGEPIELAGLTRVERGHVALSPDGARLAFFAAPAPPDADPATAPASGRVAIVELDGSGRREVGANLPAGGHRALGFVADDLVIASAAPLGGTWAIAADTGGARARIAPVDQDAQRGADAFAPGVRVGSDGSWLYVEREGQDARYLGYERFHPIAAALSPSGRHAAWTSVGGVVYVQPADGGATVRLVPPPLDPMMHLAFADDEHLVTAGNLGGVSLVHWPSQTVVDTASTGGPVTDLEIDPARRLLRVTTSPQGALLFELGASGFGPAHVIADGSHRSGFLADDEVLWTLDSRNLLRRYSLDELRRGLSHEAMAQRGEPASAAAPAMSVGAIDSSALIYGIVHQGGTVAVHGRRPGVAETEVVFATGAAPSHIVPAPGGERVAIVHSTGVVAVYEAGGGEPAWMRSFGHGGPGLLVWSPDGRRLVTGSGSGAMVLDGASGEPLLTTCGLWFQARRTPPQTTMGFVDRANVCEE